MENKFIDAKKKLQPPHIKEFISGQPNDITVSMYIEPCQKIFEKKLCDLRKFFEDAEIAKDVQSNNDVISFLTDDAVLQILGADYRYWTATYRRKLFGRLDILFDEKSTENSEKKETTSKKRVIDNGEIYKSAYGIKTDDAILDVKTFEGTHKQTVEFLNKAYQTIKIRSMFKSTVVFCINYSNDEELQNRENWFTLNELYGKGVFVR